MSVLTFSWSVGQFPQYVPVMFQFSLAEPFFWRNKCEQHLDSFWCERNGTLISITGNTCCDPTTSSQNGCLGKRSVTLGWFFFKSGSKSSAHFWHPRTHTHKKRAKNWRYLRCLLTVWIFSLNKHTSNISCQVLLLFFVVRSDRFKNHVAKKVLYVSLSSKSISCF